MPHYARSPSARHSRFTGSHNHQPTTQPQCPLPVPGCINSHTKYPRRPRIKKTGTFESLTIVCFPPHQLREGIRGCTGRFRAPGMLTLCAKNPLAASCPVPSAEMMNAQSPLQHIELALFSISLSSCHLPASCAHPAFLIMMANKSLAPPDNSVTSTTPSPTISSLPRPSSSPP
jgi:hypothetical protein